jgi:hypothetical protein
MAILVTDPRHNIENNKGRIISNLRVPRILIDFAQLVRGCRELRFILLSCHQAQSLLPVQIDLLPDEIHKDLVIGRIHE